MAAQAQKHVTHNEAVRALDAIVQLMVLDKDLTSPPGSPADGARYIVAASPTGAWAGQAGKIAAYQDGAWAFYAPREGWLAWAARRGHALRLERLGLGRVRRRRWRPRQRRGGHHACSSAATSMPTATASASTAAPASPTTPATSRSSSTRRRAQSIRSASPMPPPATRRRSPPRAATPTSTSRSPARAPATPRPPCSASTQRPTRPPGLRWQRQPRSSTTPAPAISTRSTRTRPAIPPACCSRPASPAAPRWAPRATTISTSRSAPTARPGTRPSSSTAAPAACPYPPPPSIATLTFVIDGGGAAIATGIKGDLEIPFACTINQVTLLADQSGSIVVDIWKDTLRQLPADRRRQHHRHRPSPPSRARPSRRTPP